MRNENTSLGEPTLTEALTVVGGGLGGLVAAISGREAGLPVRVVEARNELGGRRGRSLAGDYKANWGPHVLYGSTGLWRWLDDRGLAKPAKFAAFTAPIQFRYGGEVHRVPPLRAVRAVLRLRRREAPSDKSFVEWASDEIGDESSAQQVAAFAGGLLFTYEPWNLSAAFVLDKVKTLTSVPPTARYVVGGWSSLINRLELHARELGVEFILGTRVDSVPARPVIVATSLHAAARLLRDDSLHWTGTKVASLDLGLRARRGDSYLMFDLDDAGFVVGSTRPDSTLAPSGERLVQAQTAMRPGEQLPDAICRIEALLDGGYRGWRERITWRRELKLVDQTGAIDRPGLTWRDRPRIDRGNGVFVASDMSAAPGLLGEVATNAAIAAVRSVVAASRTRPVRQTSATEGHA